MGLVARERFELSSEGPKPSMLDHYTTGLRHCLKGFFFLNKDILAFMLVVEIYFYV
jgi:hypothetical protein